VHTAVVNRISRPALSQMHYGWSRQGAEVNNETFVKFDEERPKLQAELDALKAKVAAENPPAPAAADAAASA